MYICVLAWSWVRIRVWCGSRKNSRVTSTSEQPYSSTKYDVACVKESGWGKHYGLSLPSPWESGCLYNQFTGYVGGETKMWPQYVWAVAPCGVNWSALPILHTCITFFFLDPRVLRGVFKYALSLHQIYLMRCKEWPQYVCELHPLWDELVSHANIAHVHYMV